MVSKVAVPVCIPARLVRVPLVPEHHQYIPFSEFKIFANLLIHISVTF